VSNFAQPIRKLAESGIGNAAAPTGGMGLVLDDKGFVPAQALVEAWHEVGTTGQPAYGTNWASQADANLYDPAFYKDALGIVHFRGVEKSTAAANANALFTLPEGYRPAKTLIFVVSNSANVYFDIGVNAAGAVLPWSAGAGNGTYYSLSQISFRAA
jgi:hypothetical protein